MDITAVEGGERQNSIAEELWEVLEKMPKREKVNEARRQRQLATLKNLPPDFEMEIKGAVEYAKRYYPKSPSKRIINGELFEHLVRSDINICPTSETDLAKTLRSVMQKPEMYNLQSFGMGHGLRNPDVTRIDEQGKIVGAVEAKTGGIDSRASSQLKYFEGNFIQVMNILKAVDPKSLHEHGLDVVADNKDKLELSEDFKITLAVPFGVYNGDVNSLINQKDFEKEKEIQAARNRLNNCIIAESPFSHDEINGMRNYIAEKLNIQIDS